MVDTLANLPRMAGTPRRIRRRLAGLAMLGLLAGVAVTSPGSSHAAGPQQVAFVNAVNGPESIDVYIDGALAVTDMTFGAASPPITLPDQADHDIALFDAIANPPASAANRVDEQLEGWVHTGMPRIGAFHHPDTLAVIRLANRDLDGKWYTFTHPVADSASACTPGFTSTTFEGSADLGARGPGGGGSGVFGTGGGTSALSAEYTRPAIVQGVRSGFPPIEDALPFQFGSFDFGNETFRLGEARVYLSYGNEGNYGAAEMIIDCASMTFISSRHATRNPVFPASKFVPVDPVRLFDTRTPAAPSGSLAPGTTLDVQATGQVGIPANGVSAVVLNVTATKSQAPGFVAVFPTGAPRPATSSLNLMAAGQTAPNLVTVPVGDGGKVSFYSHAGVDLLADVSGYFVEADTASGGRFIPLAPGRVFDTRKPEAPSGALAGGESISVKLAGKQGIPATGVSAVVLNLTGVGLDTPGFITAFPTGTTRPDASNVNLAGAGDVTPNLVIVPLGNGGSVDFYSRSGAHVLGDVFGYFTDDTHPSSASGLFVPTAPTRVFDTRPAVWGRLPAFIEADDELRVEIAHYGDVPANGASAVLANVTATQTAGRGFVTVFPSESPRPETSNLNIAGPNVTRPNAVLVPLGGPGDISLYSLAGNHAIIDVFGYFTE